MHNFPPQYILFCIPYNKILSSIFLNVKRLQKTQIVQNDLFVQIVTYKYFVYTSYCFKINIQLKFFHKKRLSISFKINNIRHFISLILKYHN